MPKEVVYGNGNTGLISHVAVGWGRDTNVQIGVVNGPQSEIAIDGVVADPGLWMDLNRAQINRLIRSLRRARDAAYGADA